MDVVRILIAILLPPLGVFLQVGIGLHFWLNILLGNVAFDVVVGSIPVIGPVFDFAVKANRRNVRLLRRHFEETA